LQVAFSGIGSLPMAVIKRARADYEGIVQEQLDEHRRRLQAVLSSPRRLADGGSPASSDAGGSPVHLSTIHEESEEALEPFSATSFLRVLRPLQAIIG
jgi:hypothetical protein